LRKSDIEIHIEKAIAAVNKEIPCEAWMLVTNSRKREIVLPRQIVMLLLREESAYSHALIGLNCGGRDHSTVISACRIVNDIIDTERVMGGKIKKIIEHYKNETT
jgi:chromosomal replication initiator protein